MNSALQGLMQDDFPLTLHHIRRRMGSVSPGAQVTTLTPSGSVRRATFRCLRPRDPGYLSSSRAG